MQKVALLVVVAMTASLAGAQAKRTAWDGIYTEAQAARGEAAFGRSCANCHVLATEGKAPLVGDHFWKSFSQKSVGELLQFITNYMPNGNPHSLEDAVYADIAAVMLKFNGFPAGAAELNRSTSAEILPRDGSTALPANALVRVVGCLTKSGPDWSVTRATSPVRAEREAQANEDAARPLGTRTMPLKFVLTRLDALAGSRVVVNGLLIGADGVDGLNVTTVTRIAAQCP